jgi:hypothetical protein
MVQEQCILELRHFSANLLKQRVLTVSDNFEINVKHNISIGTHNEFSYAKMCLLEETLGIIDTVFTRLFWMMLNK